MGRHHNSMASIKSGNSNNADMIKHSKVSMVLNKSKYWEDRITQKGMGNEVKSIMMQKNLTPNIES